MDFTVIIPARLNSSRLPGKVLAEIAGKPMIQHVYERAVASGASSVIIATDSDEVALACEKFDAQVCMTDADHESGTERIAEVAEALELESEDIVICLQGDEPLIPPSLVAQLAEDLSQHETVRVASLCSPITDAEELFNPNVVKVVLNRRNNAMYFSRAPIPWNRDAFADEKNRRIEGPYFRHIGIYAYRAGFLKDYLNWEPSPIEEMERLEQLRVLCHCSRIHMSITQEVVPPGVDTKEDLVRVKALIE